MWLGVCWFGFLCWFVGFWVVMTAFMACCYLGCVDSICWCGLCAWFVDVRFGLV